MDFLKSLMLYMALTFTTSVQTAPAPEVTPTPTVTPAIVVVETIGPAAEATSAPEAVQTAAVPSAAPQKTAVPTPAITPNRAYRNLKQGDRGDRVKKLQERLIELGYLTGKADGAFGGQTYRAVLAFQKRNGLDRDGVAGDMTQTYLFENPDVIPAESTPTPAPTATPAPEAEPTLALPDAADGDVAEAAAPEALTEASIVVNGSGTPLNCLRQEDGVTVASRPRVWEREGTLLVSLNDLAAAMPDWVLAESGSVITLTAAGYTVALTAADGAYTCVVDGTTVALSDEDIVLVDDEPAVSVAFLEKVLAAQTEWDEEENTLLVTLKDKSVAQATD